MADVTVSTNIFECSLCPQVLFSTPEELCHHMRQYHDMRDMVIQSVFFSDKTTFQVGYAALFFFDISLNSYDLE